MSRRTRVLETTAYQCTICGGLRLTRDAALKCFNVCDRNQKRYNRAIKVQEDRERISNEPRQEAESFLHFLDVLIPQYAQEHLRIELKWLNRKIELEPRPKQDAPDRTRIYIEGDWQLSWLDDYKPKRYDELDYSNIFGDSAFAKWDLPRFHGLKVFCSSGHSPYTDQLRTYHGQIEGFSTDFPLIQRLGQEDPEHYCILCGQTELEVVPGTDTCPKCRVHYRG